MSQFELKIPALGKENEYVPEQNDIAKQAQHQLRTNQSYFSVISSLYLNNHDFSQSKKILSVSSHKFIFDKPYGPYHMFYIRLVVGATCPDSNIFC